MITATAALILIGIVVWFICGEVEQLLWNAGISREWAAIAKAAFCATFVVMIEVLLWN